MTNRNYVCRLHFCSQEDILNLCPLLLMALCLNLPPTKAHTMQHPLLSAWQAPCTVAFWVWKSLSRLSFGSKRFGSKIFSLIFLLKWTFLRSTVKHGYPPVQHSYLDCTEVTAWDAYASKNGATGCVGLDVADPDAPKLCKHLSQLFSWKRGIEKNMSYLTHLLFTTILMPHPDAFLLEDKEVLTNEDEEVLILTGGFSSQGALSSVEVL